MIIKIDPQLRQSLQTFLQGRRANLRSWREFALVHRLGAPASLKQAQMRMRYNLYYFSSNYLLIMAGLFGFTILRKPFLLFALAFAFFGSFLVWQNAARPPIVVLGHTITSHEQAYILAVFCLPLLYMASAGSVAFWLITICGALTLAHAYAMDTPHAIADEEELNREIRTNWGERGEMFLSYIDKSASAWTAAQQLLAQGAHALNAGAEHEQGVQNIVQNLSLDRAKTARAANAADAVSADVPTAQAALDSSGVTDRSNVIIDIDPDVERQRKQLLGSHYWEEPPTIAVDQILPPLETTQMQVDGLQLDSPDPTGAVLSLPSDAAQHYSTNSISHLKESSVTIDAQQVPSALVSQSIEEKEELC